MGKRSFSLNRQATCINHDAGAQSARPPLPVKVGIGAMVVGHSTKGDGNKVEATNTNTRLPPLLPQLSIINVGLPFDGL